MIKKTTDYQPGFMLLALVIGFSAITVISLAVTLVAVTNFKMGIADRDLTHTQLAIDAALAEAQVAIKADANWTGTAAPVDYHTANDTRVAYSSTVTTPTADTKQLAITANLYKPATATTPTETKKAKVTLKKTTTSGPSTLHNYAVVTGPGGLLLSGGSDITNGDVYVNGKLTLADGSSIYGTVNSNISVAHQSCGTVANDQYPRICALGEAGQSMLLSGGSTVSGKVRANNQTVTTGLINPGLIANTGVETANLPTYDRAAHVNSNPTAVTPTNASCSGGASKEWAANIKVTGNVSVSGGCTITVAGNVWITGTLNVASSTLRVKAGTTTPPVIMVDGAPGGFLGTTPPALISGSTLTPANSIGLRVITYYAAGCASVCTTLTRQQLWDSKDKTTISVTAGSSANRSEFYAVWTKVDLAGGASFHAATGQTVAISGGSDVAFTGKSTGFVVPGATVDTWQMTAYQKDY